MRLNWLGEYLASINTSFINEARSGLAQQLNPRAIFCLLKTKSTETLEHLAIACAVYLLVCLGLYKLTFWLSAAPTDLPAASGDQSVSRNNNNKHRGNGDGDPTDAAASKSHSNSSNTIDSLRKALQSSLRLQSVRLPKTADISRVLMVTAHPDDECMFFGPLIYSLAQREGCQVYVLCMSIGNFEQLGQARREELWRACIQLGVPESNIILVNATNLPDDPNVEWRPDAVANLILHTVESLDIQAIFTFDRDGVSSHPNHCAVYYAAASLCLANLLPKGCKFYTLDSINVVRKYISIFDLLCTCFMSTHWCILNWKQAGIVRRAMLEHQSQMKWFRWLYIYTSRYMFINSVREINLSDVELEMQIHEN